MRISTVLATVLLLVPMWAGAAEQRDPRQVFRAHPPPGSSRGFRIECHAAILAPDYARMERHSYLQPHEYSESPRNRPCRPKRAG